MSAEVFPKLFLTRPPLLCLSSGMMIFAGAFLSAHAARTLETVKGIQYLTSDGTLLPLVRQHDLVNVLAVVDEAAALSRLRGMLDITESPDGKSLEIGVLGGDEQLSGRLTNAVADAASRMPRVVDEQAGSTTMTRTEIEARQDLVAERRNEVMRLMQEHGIKEDRPLVYEDGAGEVEETFADAEIAAQWKEGQERMKLFNREMVKVVKAGEEERRAEEEKKAAEEGRALPEKSAAGADPAQFPDYLRARRAWEQQLAVLNHQRARQFEAEILKKRQAALSGNSGASEPTDHHAFHAPALASRGGGVKVERSLTSDARAVAPDSVNAGERGQKVFLSARGLAAGLGLLLAVLFLAARVVTRRRRHREGTGPWI